MEWIAAPCSHHWISWIIIGGAWFQHHSQASKPVSVEFSWQVRPRLGETPSVGFEQKDQTPEFQWSQPPTKNTRKRSRSVFVLQKTCSRLQNNLWISIIIIIFVMALFVWWFAAILLIHVNSIWEGNISRKPSNMLAILSWGVCGYTFYSAMFPNIFGDIPWQACLVGFVVHLASPRQRCSGGTWKFGRTRQGTSAARAQNSLAWECNAQKKKKQTCYVSI